MKHGVYEERGSGALPGEKLRINAVQIVGKKTIKMARL